MTKQRSSAAAATRGNGRKTGKANSKRPRTRGLHKVTFYRADDALLPDREAAIRHAAKHALDDLDVAKPVSFADVVQAATESVTEVICEIEVGHPDHWFRVISVKTPKDWQPAHILDVPPECWSDDDDSEETALLCESRSEAMELAATINGDLRNLRNGFRRPYWSIVVEEGSEVRGESTTAYTFSGECGCAVWRIPRPLVLVRPTDEEIRKALAYVSRNRACKTSKQAACPAVVA